MSPPAASSPSQAIHQRSGSKSACPSRRARQASRGSCALAEVVLERFVHELVECALVGLEPEGPDLEALGDLRGRRAVREVGRHPVDGALQGAAVPAQKVALGAVGGDAEDVQCGIHVAALHRELRGPPLGEAEQPSAELRLVVVRVHPEDRPRAPRCGTGRRRRRSPASPPGPSATQASREGSKPSADQSFSRSSMVVSGSPTSATSQAQSRSTISGRSPRVAGRMRLGAFTSSRPRPW